MRCAAWIIALVVAGGGLCWRFPLFHLVSLRQARQEQQAIAFDSVSFARDFWDKKLSPALPTATDMAELSAALTADFAAAQKKFGHSPGFGSTSCFLVKGAGHIVMVGDDSIRVVVDGPTNLPPVELSTGPIFGNVVRDASGLLNASDFPNSENFNDISASLNHLLETEITPQLRTQAAAGKAIRFVGCVELDQDSKADPWAVVPLKIDWP